MHIILLYTFIDVIALYASSYIFFHVYLRLPEDGFITANSTWHQHVNRTSVTQGLVIRGLITSESISPFSGRLLCIKLTFMSTGAGQICNVAPNNLLILLAYALTHEHQGFVDLADLSLNLNDMISLASYCVFVSRSLP